MLDAIIHALWVGAGALCVAMTMTFFFARRVNNYAIVDAVWSFSFWPLTMWFVWTLPAPLGRDLLLISVVGLWSVRLGWHLARRIAREHPHEDRRYAALRADWAPHLELKMFNFYQLQAVFTLVLATPLLLIAANSRANLSVLEIAGAVLAVLGIAGEALADAQLRRFKRERAAHEKVCERGLWRYSRHPNYFFEWVVWVGFAVMALAAPWGWLGLIAPAVMLHLLLNVTGVPATEAAALASKGDDYRAYQRTTNAFFPGPRRRCPTPNLPPHPMLSLDTLLAKDLLPDVMLRLGIRRLLQQRLDEVVRSTPNAQAFATSEFAKMMRRAPIAVQTTAANEQHYEVPTAFFQYCLGPRLKYSSALWTPETLTLGAAEDAMLALTCERAQLDDGQDILELGCGWGSLSLWMAQRYPRSRILAVSNSRTQRAHIEERARELGLLNLRVQTCDMNTFDAPAAAFDRVVSVEMFEHMRNWALLLERIDGWLRPEGRVFIHIFTHRSAPYTFESRDESDWMSRHFFSGGIMPSDDLLAHFNDHLNIEAHWRVNGTHYARTANAWLRNMDENYAEIEPILIATYGREHARRWRAYWRLFFMSCAQLWGYRRGEEWLVSHYRLAKQVRTARTAPFEVARGHALS